MCVPLHTFLVLLQPTTPVSYALPNQLTTTCLPPLLVLMVWRFVSWCALLPWDDKTPKSTSIHHHGRPRSRGPVPTFSKKRQQSGKKSKKEKIWVGYWCRGALLRHQSLTNDSRPSVCSASQNACRCRSSGQVPGPGSFSPSLDPPGAAAGSRYLSRFDLVFAPCRLYWSYLTLLLQPFRGRGICNPQHKKKKVPAKVTVCFVSG